MEHAIYNRQYYPRLVWCRPGSPWLICADANGKCAAIPRDSDSGYQATHFGELSHVRKLKREQAYGKGY